MKEKPATKTIRIRALAWKQIHKVLQASPSLRTPADVVDVALDALDSQKPKG